MMAATDSRFFTGLCERVYRYAPFRMTQGAAAVDPLVRRAPRRRRARRGRALVRSGSSSGCRHDGDRRARAERPLVPGLWTRRRASSSAVEVASGVLQGFYTPIFSDIADSLRIADGDVNWFEAAQLDRRARSPCRSWPGSATSSGTATCCCSRPPSPRSARG